MYFFLNPWYTPPPPLCPPPLSPYTPPPTYLQIRYVYYHLSHLCRIDLQICATFIFRFFSPTTTKFIQFFLTPPPPQKKWEWSDPCQSWMWGPKGQTPKASKGAKWRPHSSLIFLYLSTMSHRSTRFIRSNWSDRSTRYNRSWFDRSLSIMDDWHRVNFGFQSILNQCMSSVILQKFPWEKKNFNTNSFHLKLLINCYRYVW